MADDEKRAERLQGAAEAFGLLGGVFRFPAATAAGALCDGSFEHAALSCLRAADVAPAALARALAALRTFRGGEPDDLVARLKPAYTRLYLAPGAKRLVAPYESAYRTGAQALRTATPITQDVERQMRAAGVLPFDFRTEPVDSFWSEASFLSYLYAQQAAAVAGGDESAAGLIAAQVAAFRSSHFEVWAPGFLEDTRTQAAHVGLEPEYAALTRFGDAVLSLSM